MSPWLDWTGRWARPCKFEGVLSRAVLEADDQLKSSATILQMLETFRAVWNLRFLLMGLTFTHLLLILRQILFYIFSNLTVSPWDAEIRDHSEHYLQNGVIPPNQTLSLQLDLDVLLINIIWISYIMNTWCPYIRNIIDHEWISVSC